jgi:hypothetical protein
MEWVETSLGHVPVWGSYESDRPLVLAIRGAFPDSEQYADLDPPGADLALLHLPGFFSPRFTEPSVQAFVTAFDEVIRSRFPGRAVTAVGASVGAIVALGLRSPEVRGVLAVEPFFSTMKLWPLIEFVQRKLPADDVRSAIWTQAVLGIGRADVQDRRFDWALDRQDRPARAIFGDVALNPRRPVAGMPSLADEEDRRRLPHRTVSGGHEVALAAVRAELALLLAHATVMNAMITPPGAPAPLAP